MKIIVTIVIPCGLIKVNYNTLLSKSYDNNASNKKEFESKILNSSKDEITESGKVIYKLTLHMTESFES
uniref:Uncharacterized protein n=1 Tax=Virgibacillus oceani TaxID=1479511 RepID=A0A917M547_9BACI|nr:hypothetical protein GCM10011398_23330 [Virgibacillus oceani]